jgi:hypothetical protein
MIPNPDDPHAVAMAHRILRLNGMDQDRHHLQAMLVVDAAWQLLTCAEQFKDERRQRLLAAAHDLQQLEREIGIREPDPEPSP